MTTFRHQLLGCAPSPLAHYLKAVGVLRVVAEQLDPQVRGHWRHDDVFELTTTVDEEALCRFFLDGYSPTPLVAPWNGGSGFYPKDNCKPVEALAASSAPRFAAYRAAIEFARSLVAGAEARPQADAKTEFLTRFRQAARGPLGVWFDAALVVSGAGEPRYPALFGTGGNDGRLDYTNNFMQRLGELFDIEAVDGPARPSASRSLGEALFARVTPMSTNGSVGQFLPARAGGANTVDGESGDASFNPWDFVLMLEGAVAFGSSIHRRADQQVDASLASPFAVQGSASGYASAAPSDEDRGRGEQWMPLWEQPASWRELRALLGEGRCQVGSASPRRAVDVARALARLGVARGIRAFERFGYVERLGQSKLAVSFGRWRVEPSPRIHLVDEVAPWIDALRREVRKSHAPESLRRAHRRCETALLACCRADAPPADWQALLLALAQAEQQLVRSPRFTGASRLRPLTGLSIDWLRAADDGRPEMRLAWALVAQTGRQGDSDRPVRAHFAPLTANGRDFARHGESLATDLEVVVRDADPLRELIAIIRRRMLWFTGGGGATFPLTALASHGADATAALAWLDGRVADDRVLRLARALAAIQPKPGSRPPWYRPRPSPTARIAALAVDGLLRTALRGGALELAGFTAEVRPEPAVLARLAAGDLSAAVRAAVRRLRASGLRSHLTRAVGGPALARRHLAALAFGLAEVDRTAILERLCRPTLAEADVPPPDSGATPEPIAPPAFS